MKDIIIQKLNSALNVSFLEVIDESHMHKSHFNNAINSHFKIIISAKELTKKNKIKNHRLINNVLKNELNSIHALSIRVKYEE